ncbi:uncharacterized protein NPIL_451431 [Nephila pilipes]|uniref:Uncharacterized protein n=1 Tax=Nephila pilipes TaxID=299642 RepID=A0A8X6QLA2_NEPPI|nr:uncharacterized protein NPIL_451431 [Nephila pilipes]
MTQDVKRKRYLDIIQTADLYKTDLVDGDVKQVSVPVNLCDSAKKEKLFEQLYYKIFDIKENFKIKDYTLSDVIKHFSMVQPKKKMYVKKGNTYVVKKYFTEGVQLVPEGEVHNFELLGKQPIDIFEIEKAMPINSLRDCYKDIAKSYRLNTGNKISISPNTYYLIVAPFHASFTKTIKKLNDSDNGMSLRPDDHQIVNLEFESERDAARGTTHEHPQSIPGPSNISTRPSITPEKVGDCCSTLEQEKKGNIREKRYLAEPEKSQKRRRFENQSSEALDARRDSANSSDMALMNFDQVNGESQSMSAEVVANGQPTIGEGNPSVFGIRKENPIESYILNGDSTFEVHPNDTLSGSFTICNNDMDPYCIRYFGEGHIIREVAYFKNESTFETPLVIDRDLLKRLRDLSEMATEKFVVRHFYNCIFAKIEAVYKKFKMMRNTAMIGSCVPAIVQLNNTRFSGHLPDVYQNSIEKFKPDDIF